MPPACCREAEAVTLRQLADRSAGLLRQIASVATVVELLIDLDSVVAPAKQGPTSEWDEISKVTFQFIFGLCATFGFSLSVQSAEVGDRMRALYSRRGLQQLGGSGLEEFGPVDFPLDRYVLSIDGTSYPLTSCPTPRRGGRCLRLSASVVTRWARRLNGSPVIVPRASQGLGAVFCRPGCCASSCRTTSKACSTTRSTMMRGSSITGS